MDGTFKVAPGLFISFCLHIILKGLFLPFGYAMLPINSSETYYSVFEILKRKMAARNLVLNPEFYFFYESGSPTLQLHFPTSTITGCNFHLKRPSCLVYDAEYRIWDQLTSIKTHKFVGSSAH